MIDWKKARWEFVKYFIALFALSFLPVLLMSGADANYWTQLFPLQMIVPVLGSLFMAIINSRNNIDKYSKTKP